MIPAPSASTSRQAEAGDHSYASDVRPGRPRSATPSNRSGRGCYVSCLGRRVADGFPIPRRKLIDPLGGIVRQLGEGEGQPCPRIDVVELEGLWRDPDYAELLVARLVRRRV